MCAKLNRPMGLGRGLNAIFETEDVVVTNDKRPQLSSDVVVTGVTEIELSKIEPNPTQPRTSFDESSIKELSDSIRSLGLIQPLTIRDCGDGKYLIISGERRYRASILAGLRTVPAYVRTVDDGTMLEMALVENVQREDLNPMEIAFTLQRLIEECGITQERLSESIGKKRSTISNYIRLTKISAELQHALSRGAISMGHAKAIISIDDEQSQLLLLKKIENNALSVRQTEGHAKKIIENLSKEPSDNIVIDEEFPESYTRLVERLEGIFSQDISIKRGTKGEGKIVIGFKNDSDIDNILHKLEQLNS